MIARFDNHYSTCMHQPILIPINEKNITVRPECEQAAALMLAHCHAPRLMVWFEPAAAGGQFAKCYLKYIQDYDTLERKLSMLGATVEQRTNNAIAAVFPPAVDDHLPLALNINTYLQDGFVLIAQVLPYKETQWTYMAVSDEAKREMFSDHFSWCYMIVSGNEIVKIGETGNRLAIPGSRTYVKPGGDSRLGRYTSGNGTDENIRNALMDEVAAGKVFIYAKKMPITFDDTTIAGKPCKTPATRHKHYEMWLLAVISSECRLPRLNKGQS
jgi:hypothetical protein